MRQAEGREITKISESHGVRATKGDGNDILEVYEIMETAIDYIKNENKPALVELKTFRWLEHCGPNWDDDLGYRQEGELQKWMKVCPVRSFERKILSNGVDERRIKKLRQEISKEIDDAFDFAKRSPFPSIRSLNKYIYKD